MTHIKLGDYKKQANFALDAQATFAYNGDMTKTELRNHFNANGAQISALLGYEHRNWWYGLPEVLRERQSKSVVMRMKANRIKIPKHW
jgi:hypothetical protein